MPNYLGPGVASLGRRRHWHAQRRTSGPALLRGRFRSGGYQSAALRAGRPGEPDPHPQSLRRAAERRRLRRASLEACPTGPGLRRQLPKVRKFGRLQRQRSKLDFGLHLTTLPAIGRLDLRESAGTISLATSELANMASNNAGSVFTPATLLFDSRNTFLQSSASATYFESARTSFTFGGSGFLEHQNAAGLSNMWGYTLTGSGKRRMSKATTLGVSYSHAHYEFPGFHSISDSNSYHGTFATAIGTILDLFAGSGRDHQ